MFKKQYVATTGICIVMSVILALAFTGCASNGSQQQSGSQATVTGQAGNGTRGANRPSLDTAKIAQILGIDQAKLDDALKQAQSELQSTRPSRPTDIPPTGTPPTGAPSFNRGTGGSNQLLARVAQILGIDQQKLQDAFNQVQPQRQGGTPPTGTSN